MPVTRIRADRARRTVAARRPATDGGGDRRRSLRGSAAAGCCSAAACARRLLGSGGAACSAARLLGRRRPARRPSSAPAARAPTRAAARRRRRCPARACSSPPRPRPERAIRPSATAAATTRVSSSAERIASSLPGIGKSTSSGSQLVSSTAITGMPSLRASSTAMCSFLVSTIQTAAGSFVHVPQATEGLGELDLLAGELQGLLLGVARRRCRSGRQRLELLHPLQPLVHRLEVGEHATEPAVVDVRLADPGRLLGDGLLGLLLGADEQDAAALGDGVRARTRTPSRCSRGSGAGR